MLARLIVERFCVAMFGAPYADASAQVTGALEAANAAAHAETMRAAPWLARATSVSARALRAARRTLGAFADRVLYDLAAGGPASSPRAAFLHARLEKLSAGARRDEIVALLTAGTESSSLSAAWIALCLAQHPYWWAAVAAEAHAPAVLVTEKPTALQRCVKEGLRLYPAFWQFIRIAREDVEAAGLTITKGSVVFLVPYAAHRDPRLFAAPEAFMPDRAETHGLITFGFGSHSCIGGRAALQLISEVIAAVVTCLTPEEVAPLPNAPVRLAPLMFALKREGGFPLRLRADAAKQA